MNKKEKEYVWYASYGSNLQKERFLSYILGGKVPGSEKIQKGCRDKTLPLSDTIYICNYELYFAKECAHWNKQGVCFLDSVYDECHQTIMRKYLITKEQFIDVVKQENHNNTLKINFKKLDENKSCIVDYGFFQNLKNKVLSLFYDMNWYNKVICIGEEGGFPIYSFTCNWKKKNVKCNQPARAYLDRLILGIQEFTSFSRDKIIDYLLTKDGCKTIPN